MLEVGVSAPQLQVVCDLLCLRGRSFTRLRGRIMPHQQGNARCSTCSGIVGGTEGDERVGLKGRVPTQKYRIAYTQTRDEPASPGSKHGLVIELVGNTETRLDVAPLDVRVVIWDVAKQTVVQA